MKRFARYYPLILLLTIRCVEPYPLPEIGKNAQLLVVDAFLDATNNEIQVRLSRTVNLTDTTNASPEANAKIYLEEEFGPKVDLVEQAGGLYKRAINPSLSKRYRIEIITSNKKKYLSSFENIAIAPPIDSLTWQADENGVSIHVSAHDFDNHIQNYIWKYDETWEYTAAFFSGYQLTPNGYVQRPLNEDIYRCWQHAPSNEILIASTANLSQNRVSDFQLLQIPMGSQRLLIKYSMLVKQFGISRNAYDYWQQLKKNTESLGTLFDPQPSQVTGNITGANQEVVLGYFSASTVSEKRITIKLEDLPITHWWGKNYEGCEEDTVLLAGIPSLNPKLTNLTSPVYENSFFLIGFKASSAYCTDCALQGGSRKKPDFW